MSFLDKNLRSLLPFVGPRKGGYVNTVGAGSQEDRDRQGTFEPTVILPKEICDTFYIESSSIRKAISLIVNDSAIRWRAFEGDDSEIQLMADAEKELDVKNAIATCWEDARKYGSSFIVAVDDMPLSTPIVPRAGSLRQLLVFSRFDVKQRTINKNVSSGEFNKVMSYQFWYERNEHVEVDASRVVQFHGFMPKTARGWSGYKSDLGVSMIVPIVSRALREESVSAATSRVAAENATPYLKDSALTDSLEAGDEERIRDQLRLINRMKSVWNMLVVDQDSDFNRLNFPMSGYASVLDFFEKAVASGAEVPYTRFLGVSPMGFNSGDSELIQWASSIMSVQESYVKPRLDVIDIWVAAHAGLAQPPEYRFIPLLDTSPSEEASVLQRLAAAVTSLGAGGFITTLEGRSVFDGNNLLGQIADIPLPEGLEEIPPQNNQGDAEAEGSSPTNTNDLVN